MKKISQSPEVIASSHHYGKPPKGACEILGGFLKSHGGKKRKKLKEVFFSKKTDEKVVVETKKFSIY